MELYYFLIIDLIDKSPLPIKQIIAHLRPLAQKYAFLGIPAQTKNFYRSIYRLQSAGYIQPLEIEGQTGCYTTTSLGKALITDFFAVQKSLVTLSNSSSIPLPPPIPPRISQKLVVASKSPKVPPEDEPFEPLHEILVEYIPSKSHGKIPSFYTWCVQTPKLTAEKLQTKLITTFWGEERLVPRSMTDQFPELIERLFGVLT